MANKGVDRISELPHPLQHQILSLLSQKEALRICVLSKSWLHHWFTRPNVEFRQERFYSKTQTFESLVNNTLQRYLDHNLSIHDFRLQVSSFDPKTAAEILEKWLPALKIFNLYLLLENFSRNIDIPATVFDAESLQKLYLKGSWIVDQKCVANVLFKNLKTLHLEEVGIADESLKKIISSCPLIESFTFHRCWGLRTIEVDDKLHNLKHFEFTTKEEGGRSPSIEFDVPSSVIEKIRILRCPVWFRNKYQRNLKSVSLTSVRLSSKLFDFFSRYTPRLEFLELDHCYGFKEFHLSSRSINHLVFIQEYRKKKLNIRATIDAPNILFFKYSSFYLPAEFSFTTTNSSHEWKSEVSLKITNDSSWFLKLHQLLEELRGSKISLFLQKEYNHERKTEDILLLQDKQPVVVEHLDLWLNFHSEASLSNFMNQLFGLCHPRVLVSDTKTEDFLSKFFGKKKDYKWQQDLEDVSMETCDVTHERYATKKGHYFWQHCLEDVSMKTFMHGFYDYHLRFRVFRLKWREI